MESPISSLRSTFTSQPCAVSRESLLSGGDVVAVLEEEFERLNRLISDEEKETNPEIGPRLEKIKQLIEELLNQ